MRFLVLLLCGLWFSSTALVFAEPPRLIVRGDDMGAAHAVNEAIMKCQTDGIQTSIEVIVPSPWFPEAVKMLATVPKADVGIHLALSSEWDNVKWRPVSDCPSLTDPDGYFYPMIYPNKNYPGRALAENPWKIEEIERELRAQIELARKHIPQITHVSSHMGCTGIREDVKTLLKKLAVEYRLEVESGEKLRHVSYKGLRKTSEEKISSLIKMLEGLEDDQTYLFVDHPGLDTPEMRAIHHIGYEDVAIDRQGVTDAWTSPLVREALNKKGIKLIGYRDLRQ